MTYLYIHAREEAKCINPTLRSLKLLFSAARYRTVYYANPYANL